MYDSLYDITMNLIFLVVYATLGLMLFYKYLVSRDMDYTLVKIRNGYVFNFKVGIFAGKVKLIRKGGCAVPHFVKHLDGWEIVFPLFYTEDQINSFIMQNNPPGSKTASHAKDLEVYREVVIKRNENLHCMAGQICNLP